MLGPARLSPKTRGIRYLHSRIERLEAYERWREPKRFRFEELVEERLWQRHSQNWASVIDLLKESQVLAAEIRAAVIAKSGLSQK